MRNYSKSKSSSWINSIHDKYRYKNTHGNERTTALEYLFHLMFKRNRNIWCNTNEFPLSFTKSNKHIGDKLNWISCNALHITCRCMQVLLWSHKRNYSRKSWSPHLFVSTIFPTFLHIQFYTINEFTSKNLHMHSLSSVLKILGQITYEKRTNKKKNTINATTPKSQLYNTTLSSLARGKGQLGVFMLVYVFHFIYRIHSDMLIVGKCLMCKYNDRSIHGIFCMFLGRRKYVKQRKQ